MNEPAPLVEVLLRQREAWQKGARPRVEDLLRAHPHLAADREAVLDLIYNEIVLREEAGAPGALEEYLQRFGHLEKELRLQFELDQALTVEDLAPPRPPPQGSTTPVSPSPETTGLSLPRLQGCDLLGELGRGAMGVVYRGWQRGPKRLVAVKVLSEDLPAPRIGNEIEAASRLQHPHIVQVFEVNEYQGRTALVLEFVEGGNLAQKLVGRPQPPADVARLVETLAWAMAYAHGRGVIHRDLKPSNVLLSGGDSTPLSGCIPKIGDFGLAKLIEADYQDGPASGRRADLTRTTDVLGTPSYMAPEQTGGASTAIDSTADVYSLGAILYECLTGRPPFLGQTVLDTLDQVRHQDPVPPSRLQPKIPRDLEIICLKCLHKAPARRYSTARELAEDLKRFQSNEPIKARPVGMLERVWKWSRRRPAVAALFVLSVVTAALLAAGGVAFVEVTRSQRDVARKQADELDAQLRRTRRLLYTAQLLRVGSVWENDPTQGLRMLEDPGACPPDLRCFSWGVLHQQCKRYRQMLTGHSAAVTAVAWSPDGKLLATADSDGMVKLWSGETASVKSSWQEHTSRVTGLAFSADGSLLASAGADGKVQILDVQRLTMRLNFKPGAPVAGIAFHPQRPTLAVNCPRKDRWAVTLWDTRTPRLRRTLPGVTSPLSGLAVSPDGATLVCAAPSNALLQWDLTTGRAGKPMLGHTSPVTCLTFDREGKLLASGSVDAKVRLWDLARGSESETFSVAVGPVKALAFHRGGQALAVAGEGPSDGNEESVPDVQLWDVLAHRGGEPLRAHPGGVLCLAFAPDGRTLATGGNDHTVKLWNHPGRRDEVLLQGYNGSPDSISLSDDGRKLAWASRSPRPGTVADQFAVFDLARGVMQGVLRGHGRPARCLALSPDGSMLASAAGADDEPAELLIQEVAPERLLQALSGHPVGVTAVAFHPDGKSLASVGLDGSVKVWDVMTGKVLIQRTASSKPALAVAFSGDGSRLVVSSGSGQAGCIDVWDVTGERQRTVKTAEAAGCLAVAPDGALVAYSGKGGVVRLIDVESGSGKAELNLGMKGVACIRFSHDGQTLAVAGTASGVKLWDVPTEQERASLPRHRGGACFVAFSRDGRLLVSASTTQVARLWYSSRK
jgi:WD40 repeat protein